MVLVVFTFSLFGGRATAGGTLVLVGRYASRTLSEFRAASVAPAEDFRRNLKLGNRAQGSEAEKT